MLFSSVRRMERYSGLSSVQRAYFPGQNRISATTPVPLPCCRVALSFHQVGGPAGRVPILPALLVTFDRCEDFSYGFPLIRVLACPRLFSPFFLEEDKAAHAVFHHHTYHPREYLTEEGKTYA